MQALTDAPPFASAAGALAAIARRAEAAAIPLGALVAGLAAFSLFLAALGHSPAEFYALVWRAGFGTAFSWENTLSRAAPLLVAALCVALPARLRPLVIGGEGAIVLGGLGADSARALGEDPLRVRTFSTAAGRALAGAPAAHCFNRQDAP